MIKKILLFVIILFPMFLSENMNAQDSSRYQNYATIKYNKWYIGAALGTTQFYGDYAKRSTFPGSWKKGDFNWSVGVNGGIWINRLYGVRATYNMGQLYSERDKGSNWFTSDIRELSGSFTLNLTTLVTPYKFNKKWNTSVFLGAGILGYRSISYNGITGDPIAVVGYDISNGDRAKLNWIVGTNVGLDVSYRINKAFDVFFELGLYNYATDKLDTKVVVLSDYDSYSRVSLGVHYTFGKADHDYKWNPKPEIFQSLEDKIAKNTDDIDSLKKLIPTPQDTTDDDGDGVPNYRDLQPNTPAGTITNFQGVGLISPDSTLLGVKSSNNTNNNNSSSNTGTIINPVYFAFDKDSIDAEAERNVVNMAIYMKLNPDVKILVSGNTDVKGGDNYNEKLSERRCNAVKKMLVDIYGIEAARIETQANGKRSILFPKKDDANRRVDFSIVQ